MFFPQAMLVIFKFLDYLDSRVIEELRFPFSLWSLTMKGHSARKPPSPPKRQGDHLARALPALWHAVQTQPGSLPWLRPLKLSFQCFSSSVPFTPHKEPWSLPLLLSDALYFLKISHPVHRPASKIIQVSTSMVSSAKSIICAKWSDECSERTDCLSSHIKKKNNWNLKRNWWYQLVFFGFRHLLVDKKVYFKTIKYWSVLLNGKITFSIFIWLFFFHKK